MPSWQTRAVCLYVRATRKRRHRTSKRSLHTLAPGLPAAPPPRRLRDRLSVEQVTGFKVVCVQARAGGAAATPGTLVDFHGGAFISRIARQHWGLIAHLSDAARREVRVPRYGLAPRHTAADALAFLAALHDHLQPVAPLPLLGDSAGGNLALRLAQSQGAADTITGLTLIAPWLDPSVSNPGISAVEAHDPWLSSASLREIGVHWADDRDLRDPAMSPLFGPLDGLPPTAVSVGTRDICLPDSRLLAEKSPAVTLYVEEGSPHLYPLLPTPEGRAARDQIVHHIEAAFAGTPLPQAPTPPIESRLPHQ